jgi:hypothetical protein
MPRFFFHVADGKDILDTEGTEGELLRDLGGKFWNRSEWQLRVQDEAGAKVCTLTLSADRS